MYTRKFLVPQYRGISRIRQSPHIELLLAACWVFRRRHALWTLAALVSNRIEGVGYDTKNMVPLIEPRNTTAMTPSSNSNRSNHNSSKSHPTAPAEPNLIPIDSERHSRAKHRHIPLNATTNRTRALQSFLGPQRPGLWDCWS